MSATGRYQFLSWTRRGIGASVSNKDQGAALPARAGLSVQLKVMVDGAVAPTQPNPVPVQMFGPGDVVGIDPRHIIRTEPRPFTTNFEPNFLCGIEFDEPDFPWLFTPAAPNGDRLRPWLALIALKPDEFTRSTAPPNPLPSIQVQHMPALHDLSLAWNWAHAQISGDLTLVDAMASSPGSVISRLVCPRRLDPETHYTAFLVPAFETGRLAGLGTDTSTIATTDLAWTADTKAPLPLPVYFQFEFNTSDAGDFESLVRRLTPRLLGAGVGQRLMDVSQPMHNIPSAGPPLDLRGALQSITPNPVDWKDPDKTAFQTKVQTFINQPAAANDDPANPIKDDPVIAPPIYGRWHAAVQSVNRAAAGWVNELNLDPRNRVPAGFGTQVVQTERSSLMASAWQQVEGVLKANQLLRQAQLARAAMQQVFRQHFTAAQPETAVLLTAPLHSRIKATTNTIRAATRTSRVPERMFSGTFRKVTRPRRGIGSSVLRSSVLLTRVNTGDLPVVPPPKPPGGLVSIEQISDKVAASATAVDLADSVRAVLPGTRVSGVTENLRLSGFTPGNITSVPARGGFQITPPGVPPATGVGTGSDSDDAKVFRQAAADIFAFTQAQPDDPPDAPQLDFASLKTTLLARLDPASTVPNRTLALISLSTRIKWLPPDPIEPIMAAPEFPQPMYAPLRDLSPEYLLPGVELVPPETMGLLLVNHAFIEAYIAGLNHEMARQLLFNGYPTDQRGSYFRQFWDVSAYVRQPSDPADPVARAELLKDVPLEHTWDTAKPLGGHPNRTDIVENNVVLLIRGELLRRYPNAIIYAGKAKKEPNGTRGLDDSDERYPVFRGTLPDDITFLGFNLSVDDAHGGTATSSEGFFFVFQEQPSEPRFGLEPTEAGPQTTNWSDLAWTNFAAMGGGGAGGGGSVFKLPDLGNSVRGQTMRLSPWRLASQVFGLVVNGTQVPDFLSPNLPPLRINIGGADDADDPNNHWGVNSAQTAYILLRSPFRILKHAALMLPPK
jgi:hypothetical protein